MSKNDSVVKYRKLIKHGMYHHNEKHFRFDF